jgi:phenylpropionate dioxygenase-like ring-hydroxylating dioxygenase large terminal subunit
MAGDFLGVDLGVERVIAVRDGAQIRAFRNSCTEAPHILNAARSGRLADLTCTVHGIRFGLDGKRTGAREGADLKALDLRMLGDLILVRRARHRPPMAGGASDPWAEFSPPAGCRALAPPRDVAIAADWKLVIEQWLGSPLQGSQPVNSRDWSGRAYGRLMGTSANFHWQRRFLWPNHFIEARPDGWSILQVLPAAPGHSLLRRHAYTACEGEAGARAADYLASRLNACTRALSRAVAESTQKGLVTFGHEPSNAAEPAAAAAFRRHLMVLVPPMTLTRPPNDF